MRWLVAALIAVAVGLSSAAAECVLVEIKTARNVELTLTRAELPVPAMDTFVVDLRGGTAKEIMRGRTDARGQIRFRDLPPGKYSIASSLAPPYDFMVEITVEDRPGTTQLPMALHLQSKIPPPVKLNQLIGVVVDQSGAPIPGATIVVEKPDEGKTVLAKSHSDNSGRLKLELPTRSFVVRISSPGFGPVMFPVQITSEEGAWPGFRLVMWVGRDECGEEAWNSKYELGPIAKD